MDAPPPPPPSPPPARFSWSLGTLLLAIAVIAAIAAALAWLLLSRPGSDVGPTARATSSQAFPAPGESCGAVQITPPFDGEPGDRAHAHVSLSRYPSTPPASGPHASPPLPAGSYSDPPPVGPAIHSLEHGAVIIWFEPPLASDPVLQEMQRFMGPSGPGQGLHVIIAPYDYPAEGEAGRLPGSVVLALVAWHRLQYCTRLEAESLRAAEDFVAKYRCAPGCDMAAYRGEAPEAGASIG